MIYIFLVTIIVSFLFFPHLFGIDERENDNKLSKKIIFSLTLLLFLGIASFDLGQNIEYFSYRLKKANENIETMKKSVDSETKIINDLSKELKEKDINSLDKNSALYVYFDNLNTLSESKKLRHQSWLNDYQEKKKTAELEIENVKKEKIDYYGVKGAKFLLSILILLFSFFASSRYYEKKRLKIEKDLGLDNIFSYRKKFLLASSFPSELGCDGYLLSFKGLLFSDYDFRLMTGNGSGANECINFTPGFKGIEIRYSKNGINYQKIISYQQFEKDYFAIKVKIQELNDIVLKEMEIMKNYDPIMEEIKEENKKLINDYLEKIPQELKEEMAKTIKDKELLNEVRG